MKCEIDPTPKASGLTAANSGYFTQLSPETAWPIARGAGVRVALLDTGLVPSAAARTGALAGRVSADTAALDLTGDGAANVARDCDGRGSADAGFIAGQDGGSRIAGVAPDAYVVAIKVQQSAQTPAKPAVVARGIAVALVAHARVIVIAAPCAPSAVLAAVLTRAVRADVVVIAAVGDTQTGSHYPAAYPGVVGASVTPGDSSLGPRGSFVDLTAPGTNLTGLSNGGGERAGYSGSSAAAALTGGAVALIRSLHPTMKAAAVIATLERSADHPTAALPDPEQGWGQIDPYAALTLPITATVAPTPARGTAIAPIVLPPKDNPAHRFTAVAVALAILLAAVMLIGGLAAARIAIRRGWPSGSTPTHS